MGFSGVSPTLYIGYSLGIGGCQKPFCARGWIHGAQEARAHLRVGTEACRSGDRLSVSCLVFRRGRARVMEGRRGDGHLQRECGAFVANVAADDV